jgi:hypothetical protein
VSIEGPGSLSQATDAQFCATHSCMENFPNTWLDRPVPGR